MKTTAVAIDFGTSKIVTLVAENSGSQRCDIVGAGVAAYDGYLEEGWNNPDALNEAIRRTLAPFIGEVALQIRFNVPRRDLSDDTAHALMRIIRELASNATRHGKAKTIRIAGALENGRLLFSVSDDGAGFDPQRHPGGDEGHFGLDGIRERIENLGGSMEIESAPDKGSTIRISMTA